jgi:phage terminase large subunit-like protein
MLRIDAEALAALPAAERDRATALLEEYEAALRVNPMLGYAPHPKQRVFHESREPVKAFLGGNRSGKTTAGVLDDLIQAVDRESLPEHLVAYKRWEPPFHCRIVVPDFTSTLEGVIFEKLREWAPRAQLVGGAFDKAYDKTLRKLSFKNGSTFDFLTFEQDLDKFGGAAKHRIHYDEEPPHSIRKESMMRLIDFGGDELFTMTPLQGMCVDSETEILTKWGWMGIAEVQPGVPALTYNVETGLTEWQPVLGVYRDPDYRGPMFATGGHLNAMFIGDHRWVTGDRIVPFGELKRSASVTVAAGHRNVNALRVQPAFSELVGWVLSEGSIVKDDNKVVVYQCVSRYPENCRRIELLLRSLGAQYHSADRAYQPNGMKPNGTMRRYVITGDVARKIRFLVGHPKCLDSTFVAALDWPNLTGLFDGLMGGDGHRTKTGSWHFTTVDRDLADQVQMIAILLGWRSNLRSFQQHGNAGWRVTGSDRRRITEFRRRAEPCESPGVVWCPKTPNGTWVARRGGTAFITGNSWMYDEIWEPYVKHTLREATVVVVDMDDNPFLDAATKERALAGLSQEERKSRKSGRFVHFAGMIYDEFTTGTHVIPERPIGYAVPQDCNVYVGIDPGMRIMAAVVWCYLTPEDVMVAFDELALQGHTVGQVAEAIKLTNLKHGIRAGDHVIPLAPSWYVIDPAARNVSHQTGRSDQSEFVDHGIVTILGQNSVTAGINRVKERLENGRLLISAACPVLISEFQRYRWKTATRSEGDPKEAPVKTDDHLLDALRYVVMSRPYAATVEREKPRMAPLQEAALLDQRGRKPSKTIPRTPYGGILA